MGLFFTCLILNEMGWYNDLIYSIIISEAEKINCVNITKYFVVRRV